MSTILIVDDSPENIDVLGHILKKHNVKVALNGKKALEIANSSSRPDLIFLDIMMPDMDGFDVCRKLKSNENTKDIPVIFVTAKNNPGDKAKGLNLGAVDYILKPIRADIILTSVQEYLKDI